MNTSNSIPSIFSLNNADRVGATASILCAIHCGIAPVLLIFMPTFGKVWAHPASHALVALFVVPLAVFSIYKGFQQHKKRWVMAVAAIGIFFVLSGALIPAFSGGNADGQQEATLGSSDQSVSSADCESCTDCSSCETEASSVMASGSDQSEPTACVDACCPSLAVSETGEMSLHIPPAAIITTLGGMFLIAAHIGNLCQCGHACREKKCCTA